MKISNPEKIILWSFIVLTFIGGMLFEYYQYDHVGVGAMIVGYIFGWNGKKWYDEAKKSEGARR